ncbi:MAG: hypothetical protein E7642_01310 [Ruminococcaceae bacterium]|nr:hypothetical protein [Oscillospiraceae bacterium]
MENIDIYKELNIISTEISVHINELICRTDLYLSSFESYSLFNFSDAKKLNRIYKENYYSFLSSLTEPTEHLNSSVARLSALLGRADNELELEVVVAAGNRLEAFLAFETSLGEFSNKTKKLISAESFSPFQMTFEARKLRSAAETLLQKLSE